MTVDVHLSGLQLDRVRLAGDGEPCPDHLSHLETCPICRQRLERMDQLARSIRPELAAALARAEAKAPLQQGWHRSLWAVAAGVALALLVVLLLPHRIDWSTDRSTDQVRVKGMPEMRVLLKNGEEASRELAVGQQIRVRLSGTPIPRRLFLRDVDGNFSTVWPRGADQHPRPQETLELDLKVGEPPGTLALVGLFGPRPLDDRQGLAMVRSISAQRGAVSLSHDFVAIVSSYRVTR